MTNEIIHKLSNQSVLGYYDKDLKLLCVHFFGDESGKNELMAYLLPDLTWDLREVMEEKVQLFDDKQVIELYMTKLETFMNGSKFDDFVRKSLLQLIEDKIVTDDKVKEVLENGYI